MEEKKTEEAEKVIPENWQHILISGATQLEVNNPKAPKGKLTDIDGFRPFEKKDKEDKPVTPTLTDAEDAKRKIYKEFFKKPFKNLLILSGAGSSVDVGGKMISELWDLAEKQYTVEGFKKIQTTISYSEEGKNLESLLSRIDGYQKFAKDEDVELESSSKKLSEIKKELFDLIKKECDIDKPKGKFPHKIFLEKVLQRKLTSSRVKVFTLNYDMLFEKAATDANAIVIDGFSFTSPRTFSGRFFDYDIVQREGSKLKEEDNFVQRVFHLHKLHGSLDWERDKEDNQVRINEKTEEPLMVYPRDAKYEDSYEQPFFEMMARFQRNLRLNDDTLLISIGYSFNDKHINSAIEEALNQNPSFRLAIIDPGFDSMGTPQALKTIVEEAKRSERILLAAETFSDFADHFPEIQTYKDTDYGQVSLRNDIKKD